LKNKAVKPSGPAAFIESMLNFSGQNRSIKLMEVKLLHFQELD
jgi:hypothetical protein